MCRHLALLHIYIIKLLSATYSPVVWEGIVHGSIGIYLFVDFRLDIRTNLKVSMQ